MILLDRVNIVVFVVFGFGENKWLLPVAFNWSNVETLSPRTSIADIAVWCFQKLFTIFTFYRYFKRAIILLFIDQSTILPN